MITLCSEKDGERIDVFLAANIPELTRNAAQTLLEAGNVTLAGRNVKKNHKISRGEIYKIIISEPDDSVVLKQDIPLDIIYEDSDLIVVNKPKGMVVHPSCGHRDGTLVNALLHRCGADLSGIGGVARPGIVHRIDKDTSGLVIAAKNDRAHLSLSSQLSSRTIKREYEAIVYGSPENDAGTVNAPLGRHPKDRKRQAVYIPSGAVKQGHKSRDAVTHFEVISRYNDFTHVRCRLETGRTHQIRVHMAYINLPVLGDAVYGRKKSDFNMKSQCLHAKMLGFLHPTTGESIELTAELPDYFVDVLEKLRVCK